MTRDVAVIPVEATLQDAAALMITEDVGFLPVEDHGKLVGVVTDRDIVLRAVAEGESPRTTSVRAVMTPEVFTCKESSTIEEAAKTMAGHHVRRLPVVAEDKRLVGMLSLSDLWSAPRERFVALEILEAVAHHHDQDTPR
jgi:CBS domain-containing protein